MNLLCKMTGHKWDRCKCVRCGETRDEGHEWLGCKCLICGRTRDEDHRWTYPGGNTKLCVRKCSRCGKTEKRQHRMENVPGKCYEECAECGYKTAPVHSWDGCRCTVCGEQRDQNHRWVRNGCTETCSICGKTRTDDSLHDWVREGCMERCSACGKEREAHDYQFVRKETEYGTGKCSTVYANDDYACNFCNTPNACLKYPQTDKDLYKCSRCGKEKWNIYRP